MNLKRITVSSWASAGALSVMCAFAAPPTVSKGPAVASKAAGVTCGGMESVLEASFAFGKANSYDRHAPELSVMLPKEPGAGDKRHASWKAVGRQSFHIYGAQHPDAMPRDARPISSSSQPSYDANLVFSQPTQGPIFLTVQKTNASTKSDLVVLGCRFLVSKKPDGSISASSYGDTEEAIIFAGDPIYTQVSFGKNRGAPNSELRKRDNDPNSDIAWAVAVFPRYPTSLRTRAYNKIYAPKEDASYDVTTEYRAPMNLVVRATR